MNKDFLTEEYLRGKMEICQKGNVKQLAKLISKIEAQISDGFWENDFYKEYPKNLTELADLIDELFFWNIEYNADDNLAWFTKEFGNTRECIRINFWTEEDFKKAKELV